MGPVCNIRIYEILDWSIEFQGIVLWRLNFSDAIFYFEFLQGKNSFLWRITDKWRTRVENSFILCNWFQKCVYTICIFNVFTYPNIYVLYANNSIFKQNYPVAMLYIWWLQKMFPNFETMTYVCCSCLYSLYWLILKIRRYLCMELFVEVSTSTLEWTFAHWS